FASSRGRSSASRGCSSASSRTKAGSFSRSTCCRRAWPSRSMPLVSRPAGPATPCEWCMGRIWIIGGLLAGLVAAVAADAQTKVTLVPSAAVSVLHDDNIFSTETRSSDQMTLISPGAQAVFETPRARLLSSYTIDMLRSADFSSLNDLEARRHGMLDAVYR